MTFDLENLKKSERSAELIQFEGKPKIDDESRTVEVAFASEYPVFRNFPWGDGYEVIDLEKMDLTRLRDKAALLADHKTDSQIGVVEGVSMDGGGKSRALVRFGRSDQATEYFNDVKEGIRTKVSFGYEITDVREDGEHAGYPLYRVATVPFEISIVSTPADPTVGVGRSKPKQKIKAEIKMETPNTEPKTPIIDVEDVRSKAKKEMQSNNQKINKLGSQLNMEDLAREAVGEALTIQEFESRALLAMKERSEQQQVTTADLGVSKRDIKGYSILNIIRAAQDPGNAHKIMGVEREISDAIADKFGKPAKGCYVPHDILTKRAMNTGVPAEGGDLVGSDHMGNEMILGLHDRTVLAELGVRNMTGLVGNIDIPKVAGLPNVQWIDEGASPTDSEITLTSLTMTPKTIAGAVPFTRRLGIQSDPSVEQLIREELLTTLAVGIDTGVLVGATGGPEGLINNAGVLAQTVTAPGNPTWAQIVGFETQVAAANALMGNPSYLTTPGVVGNLKTTSKDAGSGFMLMTDANEVNGHGVLSTNLLPADTIIFGDWTQIIVGYWGALDVVADTSTLAPSGGTVIRVFQDLDSVVRYPQAFCQNA